jgi:hypothetical protein
MLAVSGLDAIKQQFSPGRLSFLVAWRRFASITRMETTYEGQYWLVHVLVDHGGYGARPKSRTPRFDCSYAGVLD